VQAALEAIAAYIPSEALAVYLPALGIFSPREAVGAWLVFGLGILVVLLFTWLGLTKRRRKANAAKGRVVYSLGLIGFVLYAGALPGSPFEYLHDLAPKILAFLALVAAFVMPEIASRNGIQPRSS
jgi:amino acid transporter